VHRTADDPEEARVEHRCEHSQIEELVRRFDAPLERQRAVCSSRAYASFGSSPSERTSVSSRNFTPRRLASRRVPSDERRRTGYAALATAFGTVSKRSVRLLRSATISSCDAARREVDEVLRERVVALQHQEQPDDEEVDALEDDRAFIRVARAVLLEVARHLGPVPRRHDVMADVIAVVEAALVVRAVDARDAVRVRALRLLLRDERVLRPIAAIIAMRVTMNGTRKQTTGARHPDAKQSPPMNTKRMSSPPSDLRASAFLPRRQK
jgi:hypothetical protein